MINENTKGIPLKNTHLLLLWIPGIGSRFTLSNVVGLSYQLIDLDARHGVMSLCSVPVCPPRPSALPTLVFICYCVGILPSYITPPHATLHTQSRAHMSLSCACTC